MRRLARSVRRLDRVVAHRLNRLARRWPPGAAAVRLGAAYLAGGQVALMLLVGASGRPLATLRMLAAVGVVYGLVELAGRRWARARPFARLERVQSLVPHDPERSFPSRHVASAVAMAMVADRHRPRLGRLMRLVAGLLALSRVGAGLHYPSDVAVGAALGVVVGLALRGRG
jgi:membrane-associated phospholipid phosphatase